MNFISSLLGFNQRKNRFGRKTVDGRDLTVELEPGTIDPETGLEVGKVYYHRDIKRAIRLGRKYDAAQERKLNLRHRRDFLDNQDAKGRAAMKIVRAHEAVQQVPVGTLAGIALDILERNNRRTLEVLGDRWSAAYAQGNEESAEYFDEQIREIHKAGVRPSGIDFTDIVALLELDDDVLEPAAV